VQLCNILSHPIRARDEYADDRRDEAKRKKDDQEYIVIDCREKLYKNM